MERNERASSKMRSPETAVRKIPLPDCSLPSEFDTLIGTRPRSGVREGDAG